MKLVPDAKKGWRWLSVQALLLELAILGTWAKMPADFKATIDEQWVMGAAIVVAVCGIVGRFIDQGAKE